MGLLTLAGRTRQHLDRKQTSATSRPGVQDLRLILLVSSGVTAFATLIIVAFWESYANPWISLVCAVAAGPVAAFPLTADRPSAATNRWWVYGWVPIYTANVWQLHTPLGETVTSWPMVVSSLMLGTLCLLGRRRDAVIVTLMLAAVGAHWARWRGLSVVEAAEMLGFALPLLGGLVGDYSLRHGMADLNQAYAARMVQEEEIARLQSTEAARQQYRDRIRARAGVLLDKIAAGKPLSALEKQECRLVEASLRDGIRGRTLHTVRVEWAVNAARRRGATVSLIDDRQGWKCPVQVQREIEDAAVDLLQHAQAGDQCTIRLLPVGRRNLATVVLSKASGEGDRRVIPAPQDPPEPG